MMMHNNYSLLKTDGTARSGELITPHGRIATPVFLPVGTQASVKTITPDELKTIGYNMILSNTYHLYLRPGMELFQKVGGLHKFMNWDGAILTDSGGYQVFSLSTLRKVSEEGVSFRSHIDGSKHLLTPELAIKYQEIIGADVIMVLDECLTIDGNRTETLKAMERTHRWAKRCRDTQTRNDQALFGIIQGGIYPELRAESVRALLELDFAGYAIGGLSLGEPKETTYEMVAHTTELLPDNKARYLMGVGSPEDIITGISLGVDIFDSALPTRVARNGALFTHLGRRNISNAVFAAKDESIEDNCHCYTCRNFSAAYLHHLFDRKELLAYRLATIHNLYFMKQLVSRAREAIITGTFQSFRKDFLSNYQTTDEQVRIEQKRRWLQSRIKLESFEKDR